MTAYTIEDVKTFMNAMLKGDMFDNFLLKEALVMGAVTYTIDGTVNKACLLKEELPGNKDEALTYIPFYKVKPVCFDMMKGKLPPAGFKFVFLLSSSNKEKTLARSKSGLSDKDISAMSYNIICKNNILILTTGISYRVFTKDRTLEDEWDHMARIFLKKHGIAFS